ncbi:hypothetical protein YN1_7710 [Nanoarchaeota archaeon]
MVEICKNIDEGMAVYKLSLEMIDNLKDVNYEDMYHLSTILEECYKNLYNRKSINLDEINKLNIIKREAEVLKYLSYCLKNNKIGKEHIPYIKNSIENLLEAKKYLDFVIFNLEISQKNLDQYLSNNKNDTGMITNYNFISDVTNLLKSLYDIIDPEKLFNNDISKFDTIIRYTNNLLNESKKKQ